MKQFLPYALWGCLHSALGMRLEISKDLIILIGGSLLISWVQSKIKEQP